MTVCAKAFEIWNDLGAQMSEISVLHVPDGPTAKVLRAIRDDDASSLLVIREYHVLANVLNKIGTSTNRDSLGDQDEFELSTELSSFDDRLSDFHRWFDLDGFYTKRTKIGCIVLPYQGNTHLSDYYDELRDAFAFGLYRSAISLCRALLELVLFDALQKRRLINKDGAVDIQTGRPAKNYLSSMIHVARRTSIITATEKDRALKIKTTAERVLHFRDRAGEENDTSVTESDAFDAIRNAIFVVEAIVARS